MIFSKLFLVIFIISGVIFTTTPVFCALSKADTVLSDDEFSEFKAFNENDSSDEFDEFKTFDEFKEFTEGDSTSACTQVCEKTCARKAAEKNRQTWVIIILVFTVIAGILARFSATRNLRGLFLIASLMIVGFYKAGCTGCPINSFQSIFLWFFGLFGDEEVRTSLSSVLLIIALVPVTYLLGRVYCGWICHLGALQELIYRPAKFKVMQTPKAQKILKYTRYGLLTVLIVQLGIMGIRYWCRIDPFVNIFGFRDFYLMLTETKVFDTELIIIMILVVLLLISSVFTFRPFCRTACPVGLILGLISKIPGASVIGLKSECSGCKLCNAACDVKAITRSEKISSIDNMDCIMCGDCVDACGKNGLNFFRKSKKHKSIVECRNECSVEK